MMANPVPVYNNPLYNSSLDLRCRTRNITRYPETLFSITLTIMDNVYLLASTPISTFTDYIFLTAVMDSMYWLIYLRMTISTYGSILFYTTIFWRPSQINLLIYITLYIHTGIFWHPSRLIPVAYISLLTHWYFPMAVTIYIWLPVGIFFVVPCL